MRLAFQRPAGGLWCARTGGGLESGPKPPGMGGRTEATMDAEACVSSREVYDGRVVRLSVDRVRIPTGKEIELEVVHLSGAAAVVPVDADGKVLMVRQYRYATGGWLVEVPAGKMDPNEEPEACARREVEEETGYRPGRLVPMGWILTGPGFTNEKIWLYLALDLEKTQQHLDEDEVLNVERMELDQAVRMARNGEIVDGKSICALLRAPHFIDGGNT